jgi:hypothetical protein
MQGFGLGLRCISFPVSYLFDAANIYIYICQTRQTGSGAQGNMFVVVVVVGVGWAVAQKGIWGRSISNFVDLFLSSSYTRLVVHRPSNIKVQCPPFCHHEILIASFVENRCDLSPFSITCFVCLPWCLFCFVGLFGENLFCAPSVIAVTRRSAP